MSMGILYILPQKIFTCGEVVELLGHELTCPFCSFHSTQSKSAYGPKWIDTPLVVNEPRFICDTCASEVYITCAHPDFLNAPGLDIVAEIAKKQSLSLQGFRRICLQHQLELIQQRRVVEDSQARERFE